MARSTNRSTQRVANIAAKKVRAVQRKGYVERDVVSAVQRGKRVPAVYTSFGGAKKVKVRVVRGGKVPSTAVGHKKQYIGVDSDSVKTATKGQRVRTARAIQKRDRRDTASIHRERAARATHPVDKQYNAERSKPQTRAGLGVKDRTRTGVRREAFVKARGKTSVGKRKVSRGGGLGRFAEHLHPRAANGKFTNK